MKSNKNFIIALGICLVLSIVLISANNYINNQASQVSNTKINDSGMYYNDGNTYRGVSSGTADVVVCRGTNAYDNIYKSIKWASGCDVVCKSTSSDCSNEIALCDGKYCIVKSGSYSIHSHVNFTNYTTLIALTNTIINGTNDWGGEGNNQNMFTFNNGVNLQNMIFTSNISLKNQGNGHYVIFIKVYNADYPSYIINNYAENGVFVSAQSPYDVNILSTDVKYNMTTDMNLLVENNYCNDTVVCMGFSKVNNVKFIYNKIEDWNQADSQISILTCGSNNEISHNIINKRNPTGYPIELNPDNARSCGEYNNKILYNDITGTCVNGATRELIKLNVGGTTRNTQIIGNILHDANASGIGSYGTGEKVSNNLIYNLTGRGIYLVSANENIINSIISDNIITNVGNYSASYSAIQIYISSKNISGLKMYDNILEGSPRGLQFSFDHNGLLSNSEFYNNRINGTSYCLRVGGGSNNLINNSVFNNNFCTNSIINQIEGYENNTYINPYVYTGAINNQICTTSNTLAERTIHNSTTSCTCTGGAWKCWAMS